MTIEFRVDGSLLPYESVRLTGTMNAGGVAGLPAAAFGGEISMGGIQIEDPSGALNLTGWSEFTVDETACSKPRLFTGWILGKGISRGAYRNAAGRIWDCDIIDLNAAFGFKVFRASSAKRPEETDIARVAFAQASAPMAATPLYDNGLFNVTSNPVSFGESDYITQYPLELFLSVAGTSGKNFYAYWDDAAGQRSLYYDLIGATNRTSTLRISNVFSDYDGAVTFLPLKDADLQRTSEDTYSGVLFGYRAGYVYQQNATTLAAFIDRDMVYTTDRVGKVATANTLTASTLAAHSLERDTMTVSVRLPASKVNLILAGERLQVKFSHLPGYTSFTYMRVVRRNVVPTAGQDAWYDVHLELLTMTTGLSQGPGGGRGGGPDDLPHQEPSGHYYEFSFVFNEDSGGWSGPQPTGDPDDTTVSSTNTAGALFADSTTYDYEITMEVPNPGDYSAGIGLNTIFANPVVDAFGFPGFSGIPPFVIGAPSFTISGSFTTGDVNNVTVMQVSASVAGTHGSVLPVTVTGWIDPDGFTVGSVPPAPGQPVMNEMAQPPPGGGNRVFTTRYPYATGSLRVFVDQVDQTLAVTETDPATGTFTLAFNPQSDETVTVNYMGR